MRSFCLLCFVFFFPSYFGSSYRVGLCASLHLHPPLLFSSLTCITPYSAIFPSSLLSSLSPLSSTLLFTIHFTSLYLLFLSSVSNKQTNKSSEPPCSERSNALLSSYLPSLLCAYSNAQPSPRHSQFSALNRTFCFWAQTRSASLVSRRYIKPQWSRIPRQPAGSTLISNTRYENHPPGVAFAAKINPHPSPPWSAWSWTQTTYSQASPHATPTRPAYMIPSTTTILALSSPLIVMV